MGTRFCIHGTGDSGRSAARVALREKLLGRWREYSRAQYFALVNEIAAGLTQIGIGVGSRVVLLGEGTASLLLVAIAAQSVGATVHFVSRILDDGSTDALIGTNAPSLLTVENQHLLKRLKARGFSADGQRPQILLLDPKGEETLEPAGVLSLDRLLALARRTASPPPFLAAGGAKSAPDVYFTLEGRGEAGEVVGVDSKAIDSACGTTAAALQLRAGDEVISSAPVSTLLGYTIARAVIESGACFSVPERGGSLLADIRNVEPSVLVGSGRFWIEIFLHARSRVAAAPSLHRAAFAWLMRKSSPAAGFLVAKPLRRQLGLARLRQAFSTDLVPEQTRHFFSRLGIDLVELYDVPEAGGIVASIARGRILSPVAGIALAVNPQSHIVVQCASGRSAAIVGRDMGEARRDQIALRGARGRVFSLLDRTPISPEPIEAKIVDASPLIRAAVLVGAGRAEPGVVIALERDEAIAWARQNGVAFGTFSDLYADSRLYRHIHSLVLQATLNLRRPVLRVAVLPRQPDFEFQEVTDIDRIWPEKLRANITTLVDRMYLS